MEYKDILEVNKNLKTMPIKGKDYITVNERIKAFRQLYPEGTIETEIIDIKDGVITMKATAKNIDVVLGTGHAQEKESSSYINKDSFVENCETSAVGRALGMIGIGIDTSIASYEEVANAQLNQSKAEQPKQNVKPQPKHQAEPDPTKTQISKTHLMDLSNKIVEKQIESGYLEEYYKVDDLSKLTEHQYQQVIKYADYAKQKSDEWKQKQN